MLQANCSHVRCRRTCRCRMLAGYPCLMQFSSSMHRAYWDVNIWWAFDKPSTPLFNNSTLLEHYQSQRSACVHGKHRDCCTTTQITRKLLNTLSTIMSDCTRFFIIIFLLRLLFFLMRNDDRRSAANQRLTFLSLSVATWITSAQDVNHSGWSSYFISLSLRQVKLICDFHHFPRLFNFSGADISNHCRVINLAHWLVTGCWSNKRFFYYISHAQRGDDNELGFPSGIKRESKR